MYETTVLSCKFGFPTEEALDVFDNFPSVKFRLSWTREPAGPLVERPRPLMTRGLNHQQTNAPQQLNHSTSDVNSKREKKNKNHSKSQNQNPPRIVYQVYNLLQRVKKVFPVKDRVTSQLKC